MVEASEVYDYLVHKGDQRVRLDMVGFFVSDYLDAVLCSDNKDHWVEYNTNEDGLKVTIRVEYNKVEEG